MGSVKFIESSHRYISEKGEMISVSAFTEKFKQKVNWTEKAKNKAAELRRQGQKVTYKDVLKDWENRRKKGCGAGTTLHNDREQKLLDDPNAKFYNKPVNKVKPVYKGGDKFSLDITKIENGHVYPELMIYDFEYMICGQSDKVIVLDNTIHIWDYKTDKEMKFEAFSNQWVKPAYYLPPIDHLQECNTNTYALKMSLYMYLLWRANKGRFKTGEIVIEHIQIKRRQEDGVPILNKEGKPIELSRTEIRLPYLKKEVIRMLNHYKKTNKK